MIKVLNSEIEGQLPLKEILPLKLVKLRVFWAILLSFATCLIFALILKWSKSFYIDFLFQPCDEAVGTHYLVITPQYDKYVCRKRMGDQPYLVFRLLNYQFNPSAHAFEPIQFIQPMNTVKQLIERAKQISTYRKLILYGKSELTIPIIPIYTYLFEELTGPFYILQYLSVVLWIIEGFLIFSIILMVSSLFTVCINYLLLRRSRNKLQQLANNCEKVTLINGTIIEGKNLLPGDQFIIQENQKLNCDALLINGDVMINEATLTGESIPVPKQMISLDKPIKLEECHGNCLFEGTKVVKVSTYTQNLAFVIKTGFASQRGQYFRNVLYPNRESNHFYIQACKFLIGLAIIIVSLYLLLLIKLIPMGYSAKLLISRFFDALTWIIPPALPIFFSYTQAVSLLKLFKQGVYGQNPSKTEVAGRIDTICFDKTGTLTEIGMIAKECYPENEKNHLILACCHHLVQINEELVGDPLEIQMFQYSKWMIDFKEKKYFQVFIEKYAEHYEIVNIYEYSSAKQMMSVLVRNLKTQKLQLLAKGSPEILIKKSIRFFDGYELSLQNYVLQGYRVLGLAYRDISEDDLKNQDNTDLNKDFNFVGYFVLENSLKKDTASIIQQLDQAKLSIKLISGDNALTSAHCAQLAGIISDKLNLFILDYHQQGDQVIIKDCKGIQQEKQESMNHQSTQNINWQLIEQILLKESDFAITGPFWEYINNQSVGALQSLTDSNMVEELESERFLTQRILQKTKIFSRMKPQNKKEIIVELQKMNKIVMMVGDGANDCSAIAQAQVGVSFSASDASYTAPFSSQALSIDCVIKILRQGKCTISIIIEIFQYYIVVSVLKFVVTMAMSLQAQSFSDFQIIYINYMSSIPFMIFLTLSNSVQNLEDTIPIDDMFRIVNQVVIYNQLFFSTVGYIIVTSIVIYYAEESQTVPKYINRYIRTGSLNSALYLSSLFYFMTIGIQLFISKPFKLPYYRNRLLTLWTTICLGLAIILILFNDLGNWLNIINLGDTLQKKNLQRFTGFNILMLSILIVTNIFSWFSQNILRLKLPTIKHLSELRNNLI